jgi:hypothetical protein
MGALLLPLLHLEPMFSLDCIIFACSVEPVSLADFASLAGSSLVNSRASLVTMHGLVLHGWSHFDVASKCRPVSVAFPPKHVLPGSPFTAVN